MSQPKKIRKILGQEEIRKTLQRLTHQILEQAVNLSDLVLVGIQTRGVYLAQRVQAAIEKIEAKKIPLGTLDITLYRGCFFPRNPPGSEAPGGPGQLKLKAQYCAAGQNP